MPQTVGEYELVQRIGRGGMAEVWVGRRASVGGATKTVAIKLMSAQLTGNPRSQRMFMDEARLSMLMAHSNVVQVFDAGQDGGRLFLVMEWVDGLDLARLCELRRRSAKPWPPEVVGYLMGELLQGLAYAHDFIHEGRSQCVVHRDISPHNVLVSTSGEVKIADFGVARLATEETSGMHIKGKLRYMAPEHLAGSSREPTVDLYGAGAVLHELLAGTKYRADVAEGDLYAHGLEGRVPALPHPGVPPPLASLREGLLQPDPERRIPTAAQALEHLAAWPGYRNEAASLGRLCEVAMGRVAPHAGVRPAREPVPPADALAELDAEGTVTRTSSPRAVLLLEPGDTMVSPGSTGPGRRRMFAWGAAALGLGVLGGVAGVMLYRRPPAQRDPRSPPSSLPSPSSPEPGESATVRVNSEDASGRQSPRQPTNGGTTGSPDDGP